MIPLATLYREGYADRDWYANTRSAFHRLFGPTDGDMFLAFTAATSPRNKLQGNILKALRAFRQWHDRKPFTGFMRSHTLNLERAAAGLPLAGPKVSAFHAALLGDPDAVVVDVWTARVFGFDPDKLTLAQVRTVQARITGYARRIGAEPRQVQAAVWCAFKRRAEGPAAVVASYETILSAHLAQTPLFAED